MESSTTQLVPYLYRVIHKSVKHFKNSQQIDYATDHGNSYADRERHSPSFFVHISQMLNVSTFGNMADIYAIVHLVPHACQRITVEPNHSSNDRVAEILEICGEWRHKDSVLHKPPEDTLSICEICKKNLESFSLYQRKNYHDPLRSLFVANF
jgi:hypothetical protein